MAEQHPTSVEEKTEPETAAPALPDYVLSPNAVFKDEGVQWRYGRAPDYSKTRKVWEEGEFIESSGWLRRTTSISDCYLRSDEAS